VVVVGSSIAGTATTVSLLSSRPEADVTLIDRHLHKRTSRCAGGISLHMLSKTGLTLPRRLVQTEIRSVQVYGPDLETHWGFTSSTAYGYVVDRPRLEEWLTAGAEKLGARVVEWNVPSLCALVRRYPSNYVVGADGLNSTVRKYLGLPAPKPQDIHLCVQYEAEWPVHPPGEIRLYLSSKLAPGGYAWIFPAGDGRVKVGLGVPVHVTGKSQLLERFRGAVDAPPVTSLVGKMIPTASPMKTCVYGNTALVGDAALHCDPATGGGIANALIAGNLLGQALAEHGVYSKGIEEPRIVEPLELYDVWWKQAVGQRNQLRYRVKQLIQRLGDEGVTRLLNSLQSFTPRSSDVGRELVRAVLHVLLRDPKLLLKP